MKPHQHHVQNPEHTVILSSRHGVGAKRAPPNSAQAATCLQHLVPRVAFSPHARGPTVGFGSTDHATHVRSVRSRTSAALFGLLGRSLARILIWTLLLQPVYIAFGMEIPSQAGAEQTTAGVDSGTGSTDAGSITTEQVPNDTSNQTTETPAADPASGANGTSQSDAASDQGQGDAVPSDTESLFSEPATSTDPSAVTGSEQMGNATSSAVIATSSSTDQTTSAGATTSASTMANGQATTSVPEASSADRIATTSVVNATMNASNKYVFGESDCTVLGSGEYYCTTGPKHQTAGEKRVYAEKDREGDREIYYFDGTEVHRITNNEYDDFAPVLDETTGRIVWQAMIQDRTQIMLFDPKNDSTRQITSGRDNSSNPSILGDTVVWQQWIDTNWEIMQTTVRTDGGPFDIERVTDNVVHDMFPQLYDGLLTWQREHDHTWDVVIMDLATGVQHTMKKDENTKYENPRFALLFDSKHDNGDVETVGYDLKTGEMTELGTRTNSPPVEPKSPKDKVPDAPVSATSTSTVKIGKDEGGDDDMLQ